MAYIKTDMINIYYEETGLGEPVVFIHGSFSRGDSAFTAQIPAFARTHRAIFPDLRGHGRTVAISFPWETPQLADDIVLLLDKLEIAQAHIVGHSMGGDVAMYCAVRHPARVASITSIASTGVVSDEVRKYVRNYRPENLCETRHARFLARIRDDHTLAHKGDWQAFLTETIKNCERYPCFTAADLQGISMPFLLLYGDRDTTINPEEVAELRKNIPHFTAHIVEDADHYLHMPKRQPGAVNRIILDFLCANRKL